MAAAADSTQLCSSFLTLVVASTVSYNSRTKLWFANTRIKIQETWLEAYRAVSFRRIATVEQLQLEYTHTHRIPRVATPRLGLI